MCDCDDGPSAYFERMRRARREHKCCECREAIPIGAKYQYASGVWEGEGRAFKTCAKCAALRVEYTKALPRGYCSPCFGELLESVRENDQAGLTGS